jgi:hypothetical protein
LIGRVRNPGVAGLGGKKNQRPDADNTTIVLGGDAASTGPPQRDGNSLAAAAAFPARAESFAESLSMLFTESSEGRSDGIVHQAVWQPAGFYIPLLWNATYPALFARKRFLIGG